MEYPKEGVHAIQLLIDAAVTSLAAACNRQLRWHRGPRIVPVADNYDRLRIPPDAVSRDVRYTQLPAQAVARLGIRQGQANVLVRVVLRHLDRTLTDGEANRLRDRIYAASHQGTVHQWSARSR